MLSCGFILVLLDSQWKQIPLWNSTTPQY